MSYRQKGLTVGAGPEHNLVQNPALNRAVQQLVGNRQAHSTPVIGDTLQAVIIADDTRDYPSSARPSTCAMRGALAGDGVSLATRVHLTNPNNSGVIVRVLQVSVYYNVPSGGLTAFHLSDTSILGASIGSPGRKLVCGFPPVGRSDLPLTTSGGSPSTAVGTGSVNGAVLSPYFWEKPQGITEDEVVFGANDEYPILLPGGVFVVESVDSLAAGVVNFLWSEFPL